MEQGDSVRVGVGKPDMSRRDFLKVLLSGFGALALTACGVDTKDSNVSKPSFQDVLQGAKLIMNVSGASGPQEISINYFGADAEKTPLTIRKNEDGLVMKPFSDGGEARRKPGEILENTLYLLKRNPLLSADTTIGMTSSAGFIDDYLGERSNLHESNLYGIRVIVERLSQFDGTNQIRSETNPDYSTLGRDVLRANYDPRGIEKFSDGWAVGSKIGNVFNVKGFVPIADALVPAS